MWKCTFMRSAESTRCTAATAPVSASLTVDNPSSFLVRHFHSLVLWMLGIPFVLAGAAVALEGAHPRWLGAIPMIAGLGAVVAGATRFLGLEVVPYALLYGGFVK